MSLKAESMTQTPRHRRLARISRLSAFGCALLAALPFLTVPLVWLNPDWLPTVPGLAPGGVPGLSSRLAAMAVSLLPALAMAWGLLRLHRFFRRLATGQRLTAAGAQDLLAFAQALLLRAVLSPVATALVSVAMTWERGPGARQLALRFSDTDLAFLLMAGLVAATAWTLAEAAEIADDHSQIV